MYDPTDENLETSLMASSTWGRKAATSSNSRTLWWKNTIYKTCSRVSQFWAFELIYILNHVNGPEQRIACSMLKEHQMWCHDINTNML